MTLDTNNCFDNLQTTIQQEYKIIAEYKMLQSEDVGGVYVIPSFESSFLWFGVIFIREGIYNDGIFRFTITLPEKFPNDNVTPIIVFQSEILHPLICPYTGTLELNEYFPHWNHSENHIWQLLKFIKYIFQQPNQCTNGKIANKDATDLLIKNKNEFILKIKELIRISRDKIYDPSPIDDRHYITFERYDKDVHGNVLENIKNKNISITSIGGLAGSTASSPMPPTGLSWVNEGEFKPLSK